MEHPEQHYELYGHGREVAVLGVELVELGDELLQLRVELPGHDAGELGRAVPQAAHLGVHALRAERPEAEQPLEEVGDQLLHDGGVRLQHERRVRLNQAVQHDYLLLRADAVQQLAELLVRVGQREHERNALQGVGEVRQVRVQVRGLCGRRRLVGSVLDIGSGDELRVQDKLSLVVVIAALELRQHRLAVHGLLIQLLQLLRANLYLVRESV